MDKPFKSIDQQIEILRSRNMNVGWEAGAILKREGYYSIVNGYKMPFLEATCCSDAERYRNGTSFDDVYRLFIFDRDLRVTMMRYFAQAEAALKTVCAYRFSEAHQNEREAYLNAANYRSDEQYLSRISELIDDFKSILRKPPYDRKRRFKRSYIEHYATHHDEVPLWVLTNYLMMGQAFKFFEYQNESMRNCIAKDFSELYAETYGKRITISPKRLRIAYDHIKDFRNICAHDERLYCAAVSPGHDVRFANVLSDLELVLTRSEHARMRGEIVDLLIKMMNDLGNETAGDVLIHMGVNDPSKTFFSLDD